jgi:CubicO group peptidase (beta-lactamase class C family)
MITLLSTLFVTGFVHADTIDELVLSEMQRQQIPGISIAIVHKGKIIKEKGYGYANLEHQVKVNPQTIFQSGSIGKQFTAALILLLARDAKLNLHDSIDKYLDNLPAEWKSVTIHQLLTHTSGLDDPYRILDFKKIYTDQALIELETTVPMLFKPGEKWLYSNMGYHMLGFIANKVGGQFYGDQLRQRIFEPLGMKTRIIDERTIIPHRAAGYDVVDKEWKNQAWVSPSLNRTADGSLYLTAHDLALWDLALYQDFPLSTQEKNLSWTAVKLNNGTNSNYGYGWFLSETNGRRNIEHGGAWQGFTTQISRYVDDQLCVIVLTNRSQSNPKRIADLIAGEIVPSLKKALKP